MFQKFTGIAVSDIHSEEVDGYVWQQTAKCHSFIFHSSIRKWPDVQCYGLSHAERHFIEVSMKVIHTVCSSSLPFLCIFVSRMLLPKRVEFGTEFFCHGQIHIKWI